MSYFYSDMPLKILILDTSINSASLCNGPTEKQSFLWTGWILSNAMTTNTTMTAMTTMTTETAIQIQIENDLVTYSDTVDYY